LTPNALGDRCAARVWDVGARLLVVDLAHFPVVHRARALTKTSNLETVSGWPGPVLAVGVQVWA